MKKLLSGLLGLIVLVVVAFAIWVQFPKVESPDKLAAAVGSAESRWAQLQSQAKDPVKNGYLSETFLPYWGRVGRERVDGSPGEKAVQAWLDYSTPGSGKFVDHASLRKDPKYLAAQKGFGPLSKEAVKAMRKAVFVTPETPTLDMDTFVINYVAVRAVAQATIGLAEARFADGRPTEGAWLLSSVALWGRTLQNQSTLINEMIGTALQMIATDAYVGLIGPDTNLSAGAWKALTVDLLASVPPAGQISACLETELWVARSTIDAARAGEQTMFSPEMPVIGLPGLLAREERIYTNLALERIEDLRAQGGAGNGKVSSDDPSTGEYLLGDRGLVADLLLPNVQAAQSVSEQNRRRLIGLALVSGTREFVVQKNRLPKSLDELAAAGVSTPDLAVLKQEEITYVVDAKGVTVTAHFRLKPGKETAVRASSYAKQSWVDEAKPGVLVYRVAP